MAIKDKQGNLHSEHDGKFVSKSGDSKYKVLTNESSVDEFFLYDGEERGLLAKRNRRLY